MLKLIVFVLSGLLPLQVSAEAPSVTCYRSVWEYDDKGDHYFKGLEPNYKLYFEAEQLTIHHFETGYRDAFYPTLLTSAYIEESKDSGGNEDWFNDRYAFEYDPGDGEDSIVKDCGNCSYTLFGDSKAFVSADLTPNQNGDYIDMIYNEPFNENEDGGRGSTPGDSTVCPRIEFERLFYYLRVIGKVEIKDMLALDTPLNLEKLHQKTKSFSLGKEYSDPFDNMPPQEEIDYLYRNLAQAIDAKWARAPGRGSPKEREFYDFSPLKNIHLVLEMDSKYVGKKCDSDGKPTQEWVIGLNNRGYGKYNYATFRDFNEALAEALEQVKAGLSSADKCVEMSPK